MKREPFLEAYYRIWGAGEAPEEKLALLDKINGPVGGTDVSDWPIENQLRLREEFDFPTTDDDDNFFPEEREIHISKYCWERGINSSPTYQLRYFEVHYPEVLEEAPADTKQRLLWFQNRFIFPV